MNAVGLSRLRRVSGVQVAAVLLITVPLIAMLLGLVLIWHNQVSTTDLALLGVFYVVGCLGITAGYHRLMSHRSFTAHPWLTTALVAAGGAAAQGPLFYWCSHHRTHHRHADRAGDPHSPHLVPAGPFRIVRGFVHAQVMWTLHHRPENWVLTVPDLMRERKLWRLHMAYPWFILGGLLVPFVAGGLLSGTLRGALTGLLWGGFIRVGVQYHTTQAINSAAHLWGQQDFHTSDKSRNNWVCALLSLGEGWHNNHHAFPRSARHGLHWWQLDPTWLFLRALSSVGLVTALRTPSKPQRAAKARSTLPLEPA